jgi:hypothetical protein
MISRIYPLILFFMFGGVSYCLGRIRGTAQERERSDLQ